MYSWSYLGPVSPHHPVGCYGATMPLGAVVRLAREQSSRSWPYDRVTVYLDAGRGRLHIVGTWRNGAKI